MQFFFAKCASLVSSANRRFAKTTPYVYLSTGNRLSRHPVSCIRYQVYRIRFPVYGFPYPVYGFRFPVSYLIPFVGFLLMLQIDDLEFPAFGFVEEMPGLAELELLGLVDGPELVDLVVELEHDAVELADHLLDLLLKLNVLVPTIGIEEY